MKKRSRDVYIPEVLLNEIFLRLPVKTLLRFKSVCKDWCAYIGRQSFIDEHFGHESNQDCLIIQLRPLSSQKKGTEYAYYTDDQRHLRMDAFDYISNLPFDDGACDLMGPENGIFCLVRPLIGRVALFNPATRKFKPLPPIPLPELRHLEFGFGVDPASGDYKVVVFQVERELEPLERASERFFCVYNSSSDSWRKAAVADSVDVHYTCGCLLLNGVFHWVNRDRLHQGFASILAFDMRSENFHEMPVPEYARFWHTVFMVDTTAHGDSLAMLIHDEEIEKCISKWVMGRDGLWTNSFDIALPHSKPWPLFVWKKNELLLQKITGSRQKTLSLILCDISTQEWRMLRPQFYDKDVRGVFPYKESLVSIKGERDRAVDCVQAFFD